MPPAPFEVLVVCTANLCRSPMAERFLGAALQELQEQGVGTEGATGWTVRSAGTRGFQDQPMHPLSEQVLTERGASADGFRSRPITAEMVRSSGLVLTAAREHRAAVVQLVPAAVRRTFTLRQFARLCGAVPPIPADDPQGSGKRLVTEALLARSDVQPVGGDLDDLADPIGQPVESFRRCADLVHEAVAAIVAPLRR
ncbi:arsenate reductase/protein-tyrosine-phosphatase family protein [Nakamurella leprariae]|uniref:Phosphotyrosine protein phosphatase I domain-containing protein n=1 Tax=Nakamurella leprariae TaxID=2803911 RepID=A0A938YIX1_9ACTN|nr:hypothetical protein [Nakamurella leprariae]MBM9468620.1 hypothetical protein [Nakamurella leprariae]